MSDYDRKIHDSRSAKDWAEFFGKTYEKNNWFFGCDKGVWTKEEVEELMLGWFANAMMAMHDSIKRVREMEDEQ